MLHPAQGSDRYMPTRVQYTFQVLLTAKSDGAAVAAGTSIGAAGMGFCGNALVDRVGGYRSPSRPTLRCRYAVAEAAELFEKRRGLMGRRVEFGE